MGKFATAQLLQYTHGAMQEKVAMLAKKSCSFNGLKIVPALAQWKIVTKVSHCRLCGERVKRARSGRATREYACSDIAAEIHSAFGICVTNDNKCIHPTCLCHLCHDALKRKKTLCLNGMLMTKRSAA